MHAVSHVISDRQRSDARMGLEATRRASQWEDHRPDPQQKNPTQQTPAHMAQVS